MTARTRKNLSRSEWLTLALDVLGEAGRSRLHLDTLIAHMPVSKGSFYHHFKNKRDFLTALVELWDDTQTQVVIDMLNSLPADMSPQDKLWELLLAIEEYSDERRERVIRSLALEDEALRAAVAVVDHKRMTKVRSLFREMGFTGIELDVRTMTFVTTGSLESRLFEPDSPGDRKKHLRARWKFFTRP